MKPTDAFLRLKVNELKEVCLAGGLSRQGRKADLQQRILTAVRHGGRVQQALERLLPHNLPFAHAAPPATHHHHGGASGSAIGRPLIPTSGVGTGTGELRCPCGAQGRCNPQDPSARLVRCVGCTSYLHTACLGLHEVPTGFLCGRCRSEQLDPFHPPANTSAPAGSNLVRFRVSLTLTLSSTLSMTLALSPDPNPNPNQVRPCRLHRAARGAMELPGPAPGAARAAPPPPLRRHAARSLGACCLAAPPTLTTDPDPNPHPDPNPNPNPNPHLSPFTLTRCPR